MGLSKSIEKLDEYNRRLKSGEADRIKPAHVEKVIHKLAAKKQTLIDEISEATKIEKQERLRQKLETANAQIERAQWLLEQIREPEP